MKLCHEIKVGVVEEDRLKVEVVDTLEVAEIGPVDDLGVIRWGEEEEGLGMTRLETTSLLSEGLSFTNPHWCSTTMQNGKRLLSLTVSIVLIK